MSTTQASVITLAAALFTAACGDSSDPEPAGRGGPLIVPGLALSAPVTAPAGGGNSDATVIFVSVAPGTLARAASARISTHGVSVSTVAALDGGFDPVMVFGEDGDQVEVAVTDSSGETATVVGTAKQGAPPRVVRTSPTPSKLDVPLNAIIRLVFSAPMEPASVQEGVHLLTGGHVVGTTLAMVDGQGLVFELRPTAALVPGALYEIVIGTEVKDVNGTSLASATTARFTTATSSTGTIRLMTRTVGDSVDADGYVAKVTRSGSSAPVSHPIGANDTIVIAAWVAGPSTISLDSISGNCVIEGDSARTLEVPPGGMIDVVFDLRCGKGARLTIATVTSGADLDPDGYVLYLARLPGSLIATIPMPSNGTVQLPDTLLGQFTLGLSGTSPNCGVVADPLGVQFSMGAADVTISLAVSCLPVRQLAAVAGDGQDAEIYLINSNGIGSTRLTSNATVDDDPAWSPDGSRIAFSSGRDGNREIYLMNADGSNSVRLTNSPGADSRPAWSPNGNQIAFVSDRDGNAEIYRMTADGTHSVRLTEAAGDDLDPAWSPDGSQIAFTSARTGSAHIYLMNADGTGQVQISRPEACCRLSQELEPAWSPDGTRIVFVGQGINGAGMELRLLNQMAPDGSNRAGFTLDEDLVGSADPAWSPDGRQVVAGLQCPITSMGPCAVGLLVYRASDGLMSGRIYMTTSDGIGFHVRDAAWRP